jgi:hypothetical protein
MPFNLCILRIVVGMRALSEGNCNASR